MDPKMYVSRSEGRWRVIYQGSPLCADTTEESARRVYALHRGLKHPAVPAVWNGDAAVWSNDAPSPVVGAVVEKVRS